MPSADGHIRRRQGSRPLFDFAFLEVDVLAGNRIVLLEHELLGLVPRGLLHDSIIAGARSSHELDLLRDGLCHFILALKKGWANPTRQDPEVKTGKSSRTPPRPLWIPTSKGSIFSSSALGSKPCMSSAHCRLTRAPLTGGRIRSASKTVSGSQSAACSKSGGR